MLWFHKKILLYKIKKGKLTKTEYDTLKSTGMLYELVPEASVRNVQMAYQEFTRDPSPLPADERYRFVNPYDGREE